MRPRSAAGRGRGEDGHARGCADGRVRRPSAAPTASTAVEDSCGPAARRLVDWRELEASPEAVVLHRPGMAVTLDGIAQGHLTDRATAVLRAHGVEQVLVDLGELRVLGSAPEGRPWRIAREGAAPSALSEGAVATSRAIVDGRPRILDARTGEPPARDEPVTVLAPEALVADGLSTALAVADPRAAARLLAAFAQARPLASARNGRAGCGRERAS